MRARVLGIESFILTSVSGCYLLSFGKTGYDLVGVPSLPAQARVIAAMAPRLTGAGLPLGRDRVAAAALAFSVYYMIGLSEDQIHETERSPYMEAIGALRAELIERTPAVA